MKENQVIEYIINWLREYQCNSACDGFAIGISGGIDSALTSTLSAKTGVPVLCIEMPIHQNSQEIARGKKHIQWLKSKYKNVESIETDLTKVFESFKNQSISINNKNTELALANTRARLRMMNIYYYAQLHNYLVVGTGNKVEDFGIGFFTKYGDGGVDLSPIADLLKTEVYQLSSKLNINDDILKASPTDGLWAENRTDEDQIGASYTELEWAMNFDQKNQNQISEREKEILSIYQSFNTKNHHKMTNVPVCRIPKNLK